MSAVPKLRFGEFLGDWKLEPIKNKFDLISGSHLSPNDYTNVRGQTPYFTGPSDFTNNEQALSKWSLLESKVASAGDLLITVKGNGVGETLYLELPKVAMGRQLMAFESDKGSPKFLDYILQPLRNYLFALASGNMIPGLSRPDLLNLKVRFPPLPEQKKIANFLGAVDDKVVGLRERERLLTQYKKGVMQKIFTQALRFKADDGSDFPDWEKRKFGELFKIGSGRDYKHLNSGGVPVFGTGGLMTYVDEFLYDGDSVGIGRKGTIDKPVFLSGKFWTVDTLFYTHSFQGIIPRFLLALFQRENWKKHNEASGVPSLSKSTIESLTAIVPVVEEQQKIADFLSAIDTKITVISAQVSQMQDFKKGLLQQMFV